MKKSLLTLAGIVALSTVAFAQNNGNTTTSVTCTGTNACAVQGQTLLQAVKPEGLTLTVPNEIDFTIVNGQLNIGNKPLTAATSWDLALANGTGGAGYTNIAVTAWFTSTAALTATDGSGDNILYSQVVGQVGNNGPQTGFGDPAMSQFTGTSVTSPYFFPIYEVPISTNNTDGTGTNGNYSLDLNLYIDARAGAPSIATLAPPFVYQGVVYVTAEAL